MGLDFAKVIMVRDRRLTKVRMKEAESSALCEAARRLVFETKQDMADYADEIRYLEVHLISQLMERRITVHDIYAIESELKRAEARAKELSERHIAAKKHLDEAEGQMSGLRKERVELQRTVQKIKELDRYISHSEAKIIKRSEEAEMDEFTEFMTGRRLISCLI